MKNFSLMAVGLWVVAQFLLIFEPASAETLEQAWSSAYQMNPSLESERAKLRATDEQVSQAVSHWRPSVEATSNVGKTYQYTPDQQIFGTANYAGETHGYGLQVTQPIFRGFRTINERDSAENKVLAERAHLDATEQQLLLDVGKTYLDVLRDQTVLTDEQDNEHVLEQKLIETKVRAKVGELTQTDVRQAETRLARSRVSRLQAENSLAQDRASYLQLIGHLPEEIKPPKINTTLSESRDGILRLAETKNPDVLAAQYTSDSAKADVSYNKGSLLPEINLVGNTGRNWGQSSTLPGREDSTQILIQASIPLYQAGSDYSKVREAQETATEKRMDLEEARRKARETAENAYASFQAAAAALTADHDEVEAAELALKGVREESRVGTRTTLDVLNAEQELLDAKIDETKSRHDQDYAVLQIKSAIGELTVENLNLSIESYDPERHYDDVRGQWIGFSQDDDRYGVKSVEKTQPEEHTAIEEKHVE